MCFRGWCAFLVHITRLRPRDVRSPFAAQEKCARVSDVSVGFYSNGLCLIRRLRPNKCTVSRCVWCAVSAAASVCGHSDSARRGRPQLPHNLPILIHTRNIRISIFVHVSWPPYFCVWLSISPIDGPLKHGQRTTIDRSNISNLHCSLIIFSNRPHPNNSNNKTQN